MQSNCHEAKYTKAYRTMKDGSKEDFECHVAIEFYNKIMGGVDLEYQMWSTHGYCELKHRKIPLLYFIVPLAKALTASGKRNAHYQHRRGIERPSKTP
ncbi:piggyBac transposable element-derived protein 4 [Trichonephila clavata]|uniref:PiggyBac transposable element-derived protein 4 n=1 Tax=Trichonephila clavata TaxID=2740835 RepID=A0A8X6F2A8_TRICU|nr:piggyBac transposable element-derived protein 4 [Trichonephila clavata]